MDTDAENEKGTWPAHSHCGSELSIGWTRTNSSNPGMAANLYFVT
jgi:hypothetical protein